MRNLEIHHIVPRCLGGSDDPSNLIELSFEEHLEAHRILHLQNPEHLGLKYAYYAMSGRTIPASDRGKLGAKGLLDRRKQDPEFDAKWRASRSLSPEKARRMATAVQNRRKEDPEFDAKWRAQRASHGSDHGMFKSEIIKLEHDSGLVFTGTRVEFKIKHGLVTSNFGKMLNGKRPSYKGWKIRSPNGC